MALKIIVGGQFGGEGKGKVAYWLAQNENINYSIRIGGSNSGHTVIHKGEKYIFRHLPTPCLLENHVSILAAGTYIDLEVLKAEIELAALDPNSLWIDPNAVIVTNSDKDAERKENLRISIGSTLSGTGQGVINRIERKTDKILAKHCSKLLPYIVDTKTNLRKLLGEGENVLVEGTQGYGLSLLHSDCYPYTTSRDTTAAGFLSEVGMSPFDVDDIYLVIRAYPIRVEGNSGPMLHETSWKNIGVEPELTSVTKKERRVAEIDCDLIKQAIAANQPTKIILNHLDYVGKQKAPDFISKLEDEISNKISYLGFDPLGLASNERKQL